MADNADGADCKTLDDSKYKSVVECKVRTTSCLAFFRRVAERKVEQVELVADL